MRKKTKITIDPKYILAVIAVVSILMIVVSFRFNDKMAPVQSAVGGVITPMQRGINTIGRKIAKQTKHITTMNKLLKQNDALQKKLECQQKTACCNRISMSWKISVSCTS